MFRDRKAAKYTHVLDDIFGCAVSRRRGNDSFSKRFFRHQAARRVPEEGHRDRGREEESDGLEERIAGIDEFPCAGDQGLERLQRLVEVNLPCVVDDVSDRVHELYQNVSVHYTNVDQEVTHFVINRLRQAEAISSQIPGELHEFRLRK